MQTLPSEMFDVASMEGASELQLYWGIVLPPARPALGAVAIFDFINTWKDYIF